MRCTGRLEEITVLACHTPGYRGQVAPWEDKVFDLKKDRERRMDVVLVLAIFAVLLWGGGVFVCHGPIATHLFLLVAVILVIVYLVRRTGSRPQL